MASTTVVKGINDYWRTLKDDYAAKSKATEMLLEKAIKSKDHARVFVEHRLTFFNDAFGINLNKIPEWTNDEYSTGSLFSKAQHIYRNLRDEQLRNVAIILVRYAQACKTISDCHKKLELYSKIQTLSYVEYKDYIKKYYKEVQRQMIINGYFYKFAGDVGCVGISRVKNATKKPYINSRATLAKKERLKAEGKEIYNKEKAAWCLMKGIPYNGESPAVYMVRDCWYQWPIVYSNLWNKFRYKFYPADMWADKYKGKTMADFVQEANGDLNYICDLDISMKQKVTLCTEIDKSLYLNYIRNDSQKPISATTHRRQNRQ